MNLTVKRLKAVSHAALTSAPSHSEWQAAKQDLGATFGTKKAQAAQRARERNIVAVDAMSNDVVARVMEGIDKAGESLLTNGTCR
jgi:DNA-directed RNA polymerase I subunit RPA49